MSTPATTDSSPAPAPEKFRGGACYRPHHRHLTDDAVRYVRDCHAALETWLAGTITGQRHARLAARSNPELTRDPDDIVADLAHALAHTPVWDGGRLALVLHERGWPVDTALVRDLHTWSCRLQDRVMADLRRR